MKYRMYGRKIKTAALFFLALGLAACASTPKNGDGSQNSSASYGNGNQAATHSGDGHEPSAMKGDFPWLNEVEDEFGRVAAETSSRAVASQNKQEVLLKQKEWAFSYLPKTNHFYVDVKGTQYQLVQTKVDDGERFSFATEGQTENPVTFAVTKGDGRHVASASDVCATEISYWSDSAKSYVTTRKSVKGKACARMITLLKDYVP